MKMKKARTGKANGAAAPPEDAAGNWALRCAKCGTEARYATAELAEAAKGIHRALEGAHNLTVEELEPPPAEGRAPLGRLRNGQAFEAGGGRFVLEGWRLDGDRVPRPVVSRGGSGPAVVAEWSGETTVAVAPRGGNPRYNDLENKPRGGEEETMRKAKKGGKAKKAAKANGAGDGFRAQNVALRAVRAPKEGEVPPQAAAILGILREHGKMTPAELVEKMKGRVESRQGMRKTLNLHRARLQRMGLLAVSPAA